MRDRIGLFIRQFISRHNLAFRLFSRFAKRIIGFVIVGNSALRAMTKPHLGPAIWWGSVKVPQRVSNLESVFVACNSDQMLIHFQTSRLIYMQVTSEVLLYRYELRCRAMVP